MTSHYVEAGFVFAVTGAAWVYPPLALLVGAAFFIGLAVVADRRGTSP